MPTKFFLASYNAVAIYLHLYRCIINSHECPDVNKTEIKILNVLNPVFTSSGINYINGK